MATITTAVGGSQPMPNLSASQQKVQDSIENLKQMPHDEILAKWGDLKPEYKPKFKDSVLGGNFDHARAEWDLSSGRSLNAYEAKSYVLCVLKSLGALPAKIAIYAAHLFSKKSPEKADLLARDVRDLKDGFKFIILGTIYGLSKVVLTLLADPCTLLYRFIDRKLIHPGPRAALLIVDPQYDFFPANPALEIDGQKYNYPGGTLPVNGAWNIVPVISTLQKKIKGTIVGCMDNHPLHHGATSTMLGVPDYDDSVTTTLNGIPQVAWPIHCVEGSRGQEYVPGILMDRISRIIKKGTAPRVDSYSAFYDNARKNKTLLTEYLRETCGVTDVFVVGVAYDYCVGSSASDARDEGFETTVIMDATVGTNRPDPVTKVTSNDKMTKKLIEKGVKLAHSNQLDSRFFPAEA